MIHQKTSQELNSKHKETCEKILLASPSSSHSKTQWSSIMQTAKDGDTSLVIQLLKTGISVNAQTDEGWSLLHCAAKNGHKDIVEILLVLNAIVDSQDNNGYTPLMIALNNGYEEIALLLLDYGACATHPSKENITPLHIAIKNNCVQAVEKLLEAGADPQALDDYQRSGNSLARKNNNQKIRALLAEERFSYHKSNRNTL